MCIIVVSHNFPQLTDKLCEDIQQYTRGVAYDLHVVETGSDRDKFSRRASLWVSEKCRMTRGFNLGRETALLLKMAHRAPKYTAFQLFVNDAHWVGDSDMISSLYRSMMTLPDCGQIHPFQTKIRNAGRLLRKVNEYGVRKVSFTEIVCPMIRADAWEQLPKLLDNDFFYGWGLDYDIPYQLASKGYCCYVSDNVGITHHAGTTYKNRHITEEVLQEREFHALAQRNMYEVMQQKYGENWPQVLLDAVPPDVDRQALYDWLAGSETTLLGTFK